MVFGQECLLPVELSSESWRILERESVEASANPRAQLITLQACQLERRPEDLAVVAEMLEKSCKSHRQHFDKNRCRRPEAQQITLGDWVLLHNTKLDH
jgi:hypothetical protein